MSDIKVSCPGCAQHLKLPEEYIGQTLPCPACSAEITVPIILGGVDAIPRETASATPPAAPAVGAAPPPPPARPAVGATPKAAPPPPPPSAKPDLAGAAKAASSPAAPVPAKKKRAVPIWIMIVLPLTMIVVIVRLIVGPFYYKDISLLNAVADGDHTEVRRLLSDGHDISRVDTHGTSVLHLTDDGELLNMLIAEGADLNVQDADGNTPLHSAAKDSLTAVGEALIEAGAQLNIKNNLGETPLDLARDGSRLQGGIERAGGKKASEL